VYVACLCADADDSSHPKTKTFCMASFLARKKDSCNLASAFFSLQERSPNKKFLPQDDVK
jgi:hypothetical protein